MDAMSDNPKVEQKKITDFTPDPSNANLGTERGLRMLDDSLSQVGLGRSIVVDKHGNIIAGNKTSERAVDSGFEDAIVVRTTGDKLVVVQREDLDLMDIDPANKARLMAYYDNRVSELDLNWNAEELLADVNAGVDLGQFFHRDELEEVLAKLDHVDPPEDSGAQVDKAQELQDKWQVQRGDLWQIGKHRLLCGDSTVAEDVSKVMGGEKAEYGIHDPPYGIDVVNGSASDSGGAKGFGTVGAPGRVAVNYYTPIEGDSKPFDPAHLLGLSTYTILWGANYYADKLTPMKGWLVWDKKGRADWDDNFSDCELAWTNMPIVTSVVYHTWMGMIQEGNREKRYHPTQKPAEMIAKIISKHCKNDGIILDCYAGSGSVMVACEQLSRQCRMIEIEPKYCSVILERMKNMGLSPQRITSGDA